MSRVNGDERDKQRAEAAHGAGAPAGPQVSAWLRALAERAEADPAFAAQLLAAAQQSGLAEAGQPSAPAPTKKGARGRGSARAAATPAGAADEPQPTPDPFAIYRTQGEAGLRAALDELPLPTLRAIVRERRLDPARISARWTTRERVIALIVDQVKARAHHGHAFERV